MDGVDCVVQRGDQLSSAAGVEIPQDAHVHAGRERAPAADDHGDTDRSIRRERLKGVAYGVDESRFEEVERRTVERAPDGGTRPLDREWRRH
jgi:hypothetical protein